MKTALKKTRRGFTQVELVTLLCVLFVLASLLVPAVYATREASRRSRCKNNLKQIALALHNYHEVHACLAPGWTNHTTDPGPGVRFGWMLSLLPFIDQAPLFDSMDYDTQRVDTAAARAKVEQSLAVYRCPSDTTPKTNPLRGGFGTSNYSGSFGDTPLPRWLQGGASAGWLGEPHTPKMGTGTFWWNSRVRIRDMRDGTSNVIWAGETSVSSASAIWMGVRGNSFENDAISDCSPGNEMNSGLGAFSSRHEGGAHFMLGDGTVRFISENIHSGRPGGQPGIYQHLSNRSDGQRLGAF